MPAEVQAGGRRSAGIRSVVAHHLRVGLGEVDVVAAVDREIVNPPLIDRIGRGGARGLDQFAFGAYCDYCGGSADVQSDGQIFHLPDGDGHILGLGLRETRRVHSDCVHPWRKR